LALRQGGARSTGAVGAGDSGWKEHLQGLWEEELETSFRSSSDTLPSRKATDFSNSSLRAEWPTEEEVEDPVGDSIIIRKEQKTDDADGDWRGSLWHSWHEELARMDKDKASLLMSKFSVKTKPAPTVTRDSKKLSTKLKRHKTTLKAALARSMAVIKDLHNRARSVKIEASAELARYTSWRRIDLKRITFQLVHMQLAGYHILEKIEERKIELVTKRLEATRAYTKQFRAGQGVSTPDRAFFLQPEIIYKQDERLANQRLCLNLLGRQRRLLTAACDSKLREAIEDSDQTRIARLHKLLNSVQSDPHGFHPENDTEQVAFDSLLLDQRFKEGTLCENEKGTLTHTTYCR